MPSYEKYRPCGILNYGIHRNNPKEEQIRYCVHGLILDFSKVISSVSMNHFVDKLNYVSA